MILDQAFKYITEMKRQNDELLLNGGNNEQGKYRCCWGLCSFCPSLLLCLCTNNKAWNHKEESQEIMHIQEKYSCLEYLETESQQNAQVSVLAGSYEIMKQLHCDVN